MTNTKTRRGYSLVESMLVVTTTMIMASVGVPTFLTSLKNFRIDSDARSMASHLGMAKLKAAAGFTHTRFYADSNDGTYRVEAWQRASSRWATLAGPFKYQGNNTLGYGSRTTPPSGTQTSLAQAPECLTTSGKPIPGTVCVVFNSRGWPIDNSGNLTGDDAVYLTNSSRVYGVTVSAIGSIATWRTPSASTDWEKQ